MSFYWQPLFIPDFYSLIISLKVQKTIYKKKQDHLYACVQSKCHPLGLFVDKSKRRKSNFSTIFIDFIHGHYTNLLGTQRINYRQQYLLQNGYNN